MLTRAGGPIGIVHFRHDTRDRPDCLGGILTLLPNNHPLQKNVSASGTVRAPAVFSSVDRAELIAKMRARVAQCRRLAKASSDERIANTLRGMAAEGEEDIARLLNERS